MILFTALIFLDLMKIELEPWVVQTSMGSFNCDIQNSRCTSLPHSATQVSCTNCSASRRTPAFSICSSELRGQLVASAVAGIRCLQFKYNLGFHDTRFGGLLMYPSASIDRLSSAGLCPKSLRETVSLRSVASPK